MPRGLPISSLVGRRVPEMACVAVTITSKQSCCRFLNACPGRIYNKTFLEAVKKLLGETAAFRRRYP